MRPFAVGPINAATPTPLLPDGALDQASVRGLCRHWLDIGLDGVMLLGSMGEGPLLPDTVRNAFVEQVLAEVGDRLTIFVSAADLSRERMLERARRYAAMGAHCIVLCATPRVSTTKVVADIKSVAEACSVPCAYYEVPANTGVALILDELLDILNHENVRVLKDSTDSSLIAQGLTAPDHRPAGVAVLDGSEYRTVYSAALNYDGVLHGGGALTGRWVRRIWEMMHRGETAAAVDQDRAKALFLSAVYNRFTRRLQHAIGQKYALKLLGILDHAAVLLDQAMDDRDRQRVAEALNAHRGDL
ncbi:MAG: dihydrodipicolinate synthase family protein [Kiritimatiellia bacterium]|nr:dihydrodipicolinate synthase family protein [Lentisphaerota bacterium]